MHDPQIRCRGSLNRWSSSQPSFFTEIAYSSGIINNSIFMRMLASSSSLWCLRRSKKDAKNKYFLSERRIYLYTSNSWCKSTRVLGIRDQVYIYLAIFTTIKKALKRRNSRSESFDSSVCTALSDWSRHACAISTELSLLIGKTCCQRIERTLLYVCWRNILRRVCTPSNGLIQVLFKRE